MIPWKRLEHSKFTKHFHFFLNKIVYLVYRSLYGVFFSRGGRCTLSPLHCLIGYIVMPSDRSAYGGWWWWAGVCVVLRCRWGWVGNLIPGVLTWIGLALSHTLTVAAAHWSGAPAPRIPVCSGEWRAPKWSQSYSWRIHTSLSRADSTWWIGNWITSSRLPWPPPPTVHPPRKQRGRSSGAAGGMPPDTFPSSPFPPPAGTSPGPLSYETGHQCSRHACREHCQFHSARGHGSTGRPSAPCVVFVFASPGSRSLRPIHGAIWIDEGVVAHVWGGESFACQFCYPVKDLIVMRRDKAALFTVKGVTYQKLGLAAVAVCREVWGLEAILQEEGVTSFLCPQLRPIYCGRLHCHPGPGLSHSL